MSRILLNNLMEAIAALEFLVQAEISPEKRAEYEEKLSVVRKQLTAIADSATASE